jgi:hypothetical protein
MCMQSATGEPARSLVASEVAALLNVAMLPYFRKCYKDSLTEQQFALRCRYVEVCHGLPFFSVQNPFTISMDNARTHPESRKMASLLWQEHLDARAAYDAVHEQYGEIMKDLTNALTGAQAAQPCQQAQQQQQQQQQQSGQLAASERTAGSAQPAAQQARAELPPRIQLDLPSAAAAAARGPADDLRKAAEVVVAISREPVDSEKTQFGEDMRAEVLRNIPDGDSRLAKLAALSKALDGICNESFLARGCSAQQFLTLADKTPDINSAAENDVQFHKQYVRAAIHDWMFDPDMDDALELGATYWNKCREKTAWLNSSDGLVTCRATVINALMRAKKLATPVGQSVSVEKATVIKPKDAEGKPLPYVLKLSQHDTEGSGGRWIAEGVFSG